MVVAAARSPPGRRGRATRCIAGVTAPAAAVASTAATAAAACAFELSCRSTRPSVKMEVEQGEA